MTGVWAYPWALEAGGLSSELESIAALGVREVNVATAYHSIRTTLPRGEDGLFDSYRGGLFFDPGESIERAAIELPRARAPWTSDALGDVVSAADEHDLAVNAWTVCNHGSRLGELNPEYRAESAFGDALDHALCPSHPAVRTAMGAVVESAADYGVDRIDLESIGFPSAFHGHGANWGHGKDHVITTPLQKLLVSQCFCDACRSEARSVGFDVAAARELVRELVRDSLGGPRAGPDGSVESLRRAEPLLADLFEFRTHVIETLLGKLAAASGDRELNYYVADGLGRDVSDVAPAGVDLTRFDAHLDSVTSICYTDDPAVARERSEALVETFDGTVHAGVSLNPEYVSSREELGSLLAPVRETIDGTVSIYNHSLCGPEQLDWIGSVA
ncbi:hypothetical protein [Halorarum halobium]|uniref:hypothetical protein n=1 Tax=Halorarum halobium TaxID=3075121 RepID=UPI0028ADA7DB|nr:hypothetical protein [Halobaculum sp. XH14]